MSSRFSGWSSPSNVVTSADSHLVPRTEAEGGEGRKVLVKVSPGLRKGLHGPGAVLCEDRFLRVRCGAGGGGCRPRRTP